MRIRSTLCIALVSLALAACAGHQKLDLPREQVAEVRGIDESPILGMARKLVFEAVDGKSLKGGVFSSLPRTIDVEAGKRTLRCYYSVKFDGRPGPTGTIDIELEAEAGAVYQGDIVLETVDHAKISFAKLSDEDLEIERAAKANAGSPLQ